MTVAPLQLPPIINVPQLDFKGLDTIGDAVAGYRQRSALADSLPSMFGQDQQGSSLNNLGAPVPPANVGAAPASGLTQDQMALLKQAAAKYGVDPNYLITVASKEGTTQNPNSTANGLGQFTAATAKQYGVVPGDAASAADGFARFTLDNQAALTKSLGRAPTADELALSHQQGAGGATALLSNPNANAIDALTPVYGGDRNKATAAVVNNGGTPQMTAGEFAQKQMAYYGGGNLPPNAQPTQYTPGQGQPQQAPGSPPQPNIPPQVMSRIQAMIRAGGPAQQFAMALLQKYVVPQTPAKVGEGELLVNPITGQVIARGGVKPIAVGAGGAAVNPTTGQPIYQVPNKPEPVSPGGTVVDPATGRVIYQAPMKPEAVQPGSTVIDPATGRPIYSAPNKPVDVAPGGTLVSPDTGKPVFSAPNKPISVPVGGSVVQPDTGKIVYQSDGTMDTKTLDSLAKRYLETGDNQIITDVGNGTLGSFNKTKLLQRIESMRIDQGISGSDVIGAKAGTEAQIQATKDFATGTQGNTVRSLNVAVDHLALLRNLAQEMTQGAGITNFRPSNALVNAFKKEFGYDMPTNVEAAKHIVAAEITKAVTGSNGALGDREELTAPLQTANSWDQLAGVIDKAYTPLMAGQLKGLKQQYVTSTKNDPSKFDAMLSDRTKAALGSGDQAAPTSGRQQLPKGTTGAMVVNDAKQAWAGASPQQRQAMQTKAMQYGIDLTKYGLK